jgi:ABC-2 type transport system permease protein
LIAAVSPSANAAIAIGLVAFFGAIALGGGLAPRDNLPDLVARVGEYLPFGAAHELLHAAWIGASLGLTHAVALAATTLLAALLAARLFRWE